MTRLMVVMGVCGCGKSTLAAQLAASLGGVALDADDYHPPANVAKMSAGQALVDADRWPWLQAFGEALSAESQLAVGACSALKRSYRQRLQDAAAEPILFLCLHGRAELIQQRMSRRSEHFMPASLLASQLDTLELPASDEHAALISLDGSAEEVLARALAAMSAAP